MYFSEIDIVFGYHKWALSSLAQFKLCQIQLVAFALNPLHVRKEVLKPPFLYQQLNKGNSKHFETR